MTAASTAAAAMAAAPAHFARGRRAGGTRGGKSGEFLRELFRAAMWTFRIFPIGRADQQFAVFPAFFTMELVYRHMKIVFPRAKISRRTWLAEMAPKDV